MTTVKEKLGRIKRRALVREHIKINIIAPILREQDDGGDYGYDGGGDGSTGGYTPAGNLDTFWESDFAKIFGFTAMRDIGKVAFGGARKVITKAVGEAAVTAKSLAFTLIPFIKPNAGNIIDMAKQDREGMKARMSEISSGYADILKKNDQIFSNPDFSLMAFIANPGLMVAAAVAKGTTNVAEQLYDSFVPGDNNRRQNDNLIEQSLAGLKQLFNVPKETPIDTESLLASLYGTNAKTPRLHEQAVQQQQINPVEVIKAGFSNSPQAQAFLQTIVAANDANKKYLQSPLAVANINKSPVVQEGRQFLVNQVIEAAKKTFGEITVSNLKSKYATQIAGYFKSQKVEDPTEKDKMLADPKFQKALITIIKSTFLPIYVKQLDELLKLNPTGLSRQVAEAKKTIEAMSAQVN